jgi:hypothetical protein
MSRLDWKTLFPYELVEANWRLWSFITILVVGFWALIAFPVGQTLGYIDPFYSPALLIVPIPGALRLTCYAYRKDYHRHLFNHPLGCANPNRADAENRHYTGEKSAVFQLENFHRYFLYVVIALLPFFYYDFVHSLAYSDSLRLGSLLLLANALTLTAWTLSCHAFRHVIGGNVDCYSCVAAGGFRKGVYERQSWLNKHHEALAWISLLTIFFADLYIRGLAAHLSIDATLLRF